MSHGLRPSSNHSLNLFLTPLWRSVLLTHLRTFFSCFERSKKKCSLSFSDGGSPLKIETGLIKSVASYLAPHFSQLSPYCSFAPQEGHVP